MTVALSRGIAFACFVVAMLLLLMEPVAARADATTTPSPAPTSTPVPPIAVRGHYLGEVAANPSGGFKQGSALASEFMIGADFNFKELTGAGGVLHMILTDRWGSSLSANAIGNIMTVQEIYGDGLTPRLTELAYQQSFANGKVDVVAGRAITENDFAASPAYWGGVSLYCTFQNNGICGTPIAAPINSGYVAYPSSSWGGRVKVFPSHDFAIDVGAYQVNPTYGLRGHGFDFGTGGDTGVFFPIEFDFTLRNPTGAQVGSVQVGAYDDTSTVAGVEQQLTRFVPADSPALTFLPTTTYAGRFGYWVAADHLLAGSAAKGSDGLAAFAAAQYGDPRTSLLSFFGDAGLVQHGTFPGRGNDTVSLGFAYADVNAALRSFEASLQQAGLAVPLTGQEKIVEFNYGAQIAPDFTLRPGVQYVFQPSGEKTIPSAWVTDLQAVLTF